MGLSKSITELFAGRFSRISPVENLKHSLIQNQREILDQNESQMDKGVDSEGNSIGSYKFFEYKNRYEPVDLLLTGSFRDKMFLTIDNEKTAISSTDEKRQRLVKKYGDDIFGIYDKKRMAATIGPEFFKSYKEDLL